MERTLVVVALLLAMPTLAVGQEWWEDDVGEYPPIILELNAWLSEISGSIQWGDEGAPGSEIDFREDLDFMDQTVNPYIRLDIGISDQWNVILSFWHNRFDAETELPRTISFAGRDFPAGEEVKSEFSMNAYDLMLGYTFIDGEQIDMALLFGAGVYSTNMRIEDLATQTETEKDSIIPAPQVGLALDIALTDTFGFRCQIMGIAMDAHDVSGQAFDAEAAITWTIYDGLYVTGGYKLFRADAEFYTDEEDVTNKADFDIEGPYVGLGLVF
jgi:hypothetical protein